MELQPHPGLLVATGLVDRVPGLVLGVLRVLGVVLREVLGWVLLLLEVTAVVLVELVIVVVVILA